MTSNLGKCAYTLGSALILTSAFACATRLHGSQETDPWAQLKGQTAWIILGVVDASTSESAMLPGYTVVGKDGLGLPGDRRLPATGDILVVTHDRPLYILGFKVSGESRRLEPLTRASPEDRDLTGGVLKPGARVVVQEVRRDVDSQCDTLCTVWARVTPERRD